MAQGKKSFIIYVSWKTWLDALNDLQKGQWLNWMLDYTNDLNPKYPSDKVVELACRMAQDTLKRDLKKYEERCERMQKVNEERSRKQEMQQHNNIVTKSQQYRSEVVGDNDNDNDNVNDNDNDINIKEKVIKEKSTTTRFNPPTLQEVEIYCLERRNLVDPSKFYDFYQSKGWMVGKNKMKDWKAAVRTWERESGFKPNDTETNQEVNGGFKEI